MAVSPGKHHGVRPVEDGVRHVGRFRPRRPAGVNHRIEHLRRGDDRNPGLLARPDDSLLNHRHVLHRTLDAEVAARDHHAVCRVYDLFKVIDRTAALDFGDDGDVGPELLQHLADLVHVVRVPDETRGDEVRPLFGRETEVLSVLLGDDAET